MKFISCLIIAMITFINGGFAQSSIEGDQLLSVLGKSPSDPLFVQLKTQETFYTDAWSADFSIYAAINDNVIQKVELQNGKLRSGTSERYGVYKKQLPMQLNWNMNAAEFKEKLGPGISNTIMPFTDYTHNGYDIRIFFEQNKATAIGFALSKGKSLAITKVLSQTSAVNFSNSIAYAAPLTFDSASATASVNWSALKSLIISSGTLLTKAGHDSVDYIGEVYYSTPWKVQGFERTAIKRIKRSNIIYYESFFKTQADTEKVRSMFFALYGALKKTIKDSSGNDFLLASVAKKFISESPVNWLAQWSLNDNYNTLPKGLNKVKLCLMLSGMKDSFEKDKMKYTIKLYLADQEVKYDLFTWDKPL